MKRVHLLLSVLLSSFFLFPACGTADPAPVGSPSAAFVSAGVDGLEPDGWKLVELSPETGLRVYGMALPAPERTTVRALYNAVLVDSAGESRPLPVAGPVQDVRIFEDKDRTQVAMLDAGGGLILWDARSAQVSKLATDVFPGFGFSPDGVYIAYTAGPIPEMDLYRIRLDTREILRLTNENGSVAGPAFSPDGKEIVFVSSLGGYPSLAVIPSAGGTTRRITNATLPADGTPVHSSRLAPFPDGRRGPLWAEKGFVFENDAGVYRISADGATTGHWPGARFPVVTQGRILVHDGRSLVPLADQEVNP
ncbi:MAG: hypothetical protein CVU65_00655 [Deltaproteobacteria bacterium HGW-Deltaproteobacteria-22]|jgi:outer membrane protein assembly factor BamB|nr:MAG: hypothetical protein CVU65_00655 [Deltaproteobacteria bacterium HGW-Deltaproteobacteria-22]